MYGAATPGPRLMMAQPLTIQKLFKQSVRLSEQ